MVENLILFGEILKYFFMFLGMIFVLILIFLIKDRNRKNKELIYKAQNNLSRK